MPFKFFVKLRGVCLLRICGVKVVWLASVVLCMKLGTLSSEKCIIEWLDLVILFGSFICFYGSALVGAWDPTWAPKECVSHGGCIVFILSFILYANALLRAEPHSRYLGYWQTLC